MSDARQGDTVVVRKSSQSTAKETEELRLLPPAVALLVVAVAVAL